MLRVLVAEEDEALGLHAAGRIGSVGTFSPGTGEAAFDQSVYEDLNSCRRARTAISLPPTSRRAASRRPALNLVFWTFAACRSVRRGDLYAARPLPHKP